MIAEPLVVELVRAALAARRRAAHPADRRGRRRTRSCRGPARSSWRGCRRWRCGRRRRWTPGSSVIASWNTRELSDIDPARMAARVGRCGPSCRRLMQRAARGEMNWCVTAFPCNALAQDADMSLADYEDFVYRAGWMHLADPVAAWRSFADKLNQVADRLSGVKTLRMVAEDTDLTVGVAGRGGRAPTGRTTSPTARCSRARWRARPAATCASRSRPSTAAARWRTCGCGSRAAGWSRARRSRGGDLLRADAGDGRRRVGAGRVRDRHQLRHRAVHASRSCSTRRSAAPCHMARRRRLPGDGQPQPLGAALGHGLRHARRRRDLRRRRADLLAPGGSCPSSRPTCLRPKPEPHRRRRSHQRAHPGNVGHERQVVQAQQLHAEVRRDRDHGGRALQARLGSPSGSAVTSLCEQASISG